MKNLLLLIFIMLNIAVYSQKSFSVGGGLEYNLSVESPGANARAYYNIGDHLCFGPEFSIFLPKTTKHADETEEVFVWELNFNAHYIFEIIHKLGIYPIVGLNYTSERKEMYHNAFSEPEKHTETAWAANFGIGIHIPLKSVTPFLEYHFTTGDLGEHILTAGLFYTFGKQEKEIH